MTDLFNQLILLNVELEGALRVAASRPSVEAISSAKQKFEELSKLFEKLNNGFIISDETNDERLTDLKEQEAEGGENNPLEEPVKKPNEEELLREIEDTDNEETFEVDVDENTTKEFDIEDNVETVSTDNHNEAKPHDTVESELTIEDEEPEVLEIESTVAEDSKPKETTASKISKSDKKDIRKMLTLNDKFLFKRELFANNDAEFNDTLDLIASMNSIDEAKEYLFEDLRFDPENENVKDFINIVNAYFA